MCCGFKALEFWMLWLSITSAGFISSTVFDISTMTDENGKSFKDADDTDSDMEIFPLIYSAMMAFLFLMVLLLVLHCCPSKRRIARSGRKLYMIRLVQWVKLLVLVATLAVVQSTHYMAFKQGDDFNVGRVLLGCGFVGAVIELLILRTDLHATNQIGVFAKTFAEATLSAMVAAQLVRVDQLYFLVAAGGTTVAYAMFTATCVHDPILRIQLEPYTAVLGFILGLALAMMFEATHNFRPTSEIVAYSFLFAFNFAVPVVKTQYEHVWLESGYEKSYRQAGTRATSLV